MRVLFLTHRLPYAPNRGDRIRAYHIIRTLAKQTSLEVVSLAHDEHELAEIDSVRALGARVDVRLNILSGGITVEDSSRNHLATSGSLFISF